MTTIAQIRIRTIALPAEHGGWGFLLEPLVLGMLLYPSWSGLALAVGMFGLFLMRQPFKMTVTDWRRRRRFARTKVAERFVLLYGFIAVAGFGIAVLSSRWEVLLPFVLVSPLMALQIGYDAFNRGRSLIPELAGPAALAASGAAIVLAGEGSYTIAFTVWLILVARAIPSILYVRARLSLEHGSPVSPLPVLLAHVISVLIVGVFAFYSLVPWLTVLALLVLLIRAALGLSARRVPTVPKVIGFREIGYGLMVVLATALGYVLLLGVF